MPILSDGNKCTNNSDEKNLTQLGERQITATLRELNEAGLIAAQAYD